MIKGIIADEAPDIINVHMPVPYLTDLVIFAPKGIPKVVTYHSGSMKKHLIAVHDGLHGVTQSDGVAQRRDREGGRHAFADRITEESHPSPSM